MGPPRRQNAQKRYDVLAEAWKRFANWGGSNQTSGFDEASTDWDSVRRVLGTFERLTHHEAPSPILCASH